MQNLKLEILDTLCLYVTLYFIPLTLKTSKSFAIRHVTPFLHSFSWIIGNLVYIKKYKDAKRFQIFKVKILKDPNIGLHA